MKTTARLAAYLLLLLLLSLISSFSLPALAKAAHAKGTLKERAKNPEHRTASAPRKGSEESQQLSDASTKVSKFATIDFAELAQREKLNPPAQARRIVPEPQEEEKAQNRPVPPDAVLFRDESGAPAPLLPLGPSPAVAASFQGVQSRGGFPPDTQGAAGPNHLLAVVNGNILVQSKTGSNLATATLAGFFAGGSITNDVFDPRVQYDPYGNRWILIADADRM